VPGTHLEIADGPEAFAAAVVALLADPARRASLGREGRALVETQYSWRQVTHTFEAFLERTAARPKTVSGSAPHRESFATQNN